MTDKLQRTLTSTVIATLIVGLLDYDEWGTWAFAVELVVFATLFGVVSYLVSRHTDWLG